MPRTPAEPPPVDPRQVRWSPSVWLATGLGLGLAPVAPGTVGALLGLPLAWGVAHLPWWSQILAIGVLALVGIPVCTTAARELDRKDPGMIVLDEIASMPITFFLLTPAAMAQPIVLIAGFALNRLFDISKLPPARQAERLPEGLGIMADDWVAGVYSCATLHLLLWLGWLPIPGG